MDCPASSWRNSHPAPQKPSTAPRTGWSAQYAAASIARATRGRSGGIPNRARIKAFAPDANVLVLFVYKDSQVPFSDDRFSYGAAVLKRGLDAALVNRVVDFALSGFDPARRPPDVRKTFPYTVPR